MARGKTVPMTNDRRLVCDVIDVARKMPIVPVERTMDLSELVRLRRLARPKITWPVIFMRAYAVVARDNPLLRRIYVPLPRQYYYEHPESVCLLTISRKIEGREQLVFARFSQPENCSLAELQARFDDVRRRPLRDLKQMRHQIRFSNMPWLVRKLGWSLMTNWMPASRAKQMGTFGMSPSSIRDTHGTWHLGPCTTILGYEQFINNGLARITLTFDHRVVDGKPAADVLEALRVVLLGQMCDELRMMCPPQAGLASPGSLRLAG
jgi:hypothetical protein